MTAPLVIGRKLLLDRVSSPGGTLLKLSGVIDDSFDRAQLIREIHGVAIFDLNGVSQITSLGVREWMAALRQLGPETYYCFVHCHPSLVAQFNMVNHFGMEGQLISLYSPFLCPTCDHYFEVLTDLRRRYADIADFRVGSTACPRCGGDAAFDDIPENYFAYVAGAVRPSPPPRATAIIDGESGSGGVPFRIEKEIDQDLTFLWLSGDLVRAAHFKRLADGLEGSVLLMLQQVDSVQEAGLTALIKFLQTPDLDLLMARLPMRLAKLLSSIAGGLGGAQVVSLLVPMRCNTDGEYEGDVAGNVLARSPPRGNFPSCPRCGVEGKLAVEEGDLQWIRRLPLRSPAPRLLEALGVRPTGPRVERILRIEGDSSGLTPTPTGPNVFGRYELVRRIGIGGMAEVFLARQHGPMGFEKRVVLKRILPQYLEGESFVQMFLEEARLAARISHPNVVQIFDLGRVLDQYFIAMEYVQGCDLALALRLAREGHSAVPLPVAAEIVKLLCAGLHAAHNCVDERGQSIAILHRDVSPHNVLLAEDGSVKVTDFGIAKIASSAARTDPDVVKGKMAYLAPEVFSRTDALDCRVDVFAAGVILFECLTLTQPFQRHHDAATMAAIEALDFAPPRSLRAEIPEALEAIVQRALAPVAQRYASAREMQQDLEAFLSSCPGSGSGVVASWVNTVAASQVAPDWDNARTGSALLQFTPPPVRGLDRSSQTTEVGTPRRRTES